MSDLSLENFERTNSEQEPKRANKDSRPKPSRVMIRLIILRDKLRQWRNALKLPNLSDENRKVIESKYDKGVRLLKKLQEDAKAKFRNFGVNAAAMLHQLKSAESSRNNYKGEIIEFLKSEFFVSSAYLKDNKVCTVYINCANAIRLKNILKFENVETINNKLNISKVYVSVGFMKKGFISNIETNGNFDITPLSGWNNDNTIRNLYADICIKTNKEYESCKTNFLDKEQIKNNFFYMPISDNDNDKEIKTVNKDYCKILITCSNLEKLVNLMLSNIPVPEDNNILVPEDNNIEILVRTLFTKEKAKITFLNPNNYSFTIKYDNISSKLFTQATEFEFDKLCTTNEDYTRYLMCNSSQSSSSSGPFDDRGVVNTDNLSASITLQREHDDRPLLGVNELDLLNSNMGNPPP